MQTTITLKVNPDEGDSEEMTIVKNGNLSLEQAKALICCPSQCTVEPCECGEEEVNCDFDVNPVFIEDSYYPEITGFTGVQTAGEPTEANVTVTIEKTPFHASSLHLRVEDHNGQAGLILSKVSDMSLHENADQVYFPLVSADGHDPANQLIAPGRHEILEYIDLGTEVKIVLATTEFQAGIFTQQSNWSIAFIDKEAPKTPLVTQFTIPDGQATIDQFTTLQMIATFHVEVSFVCNGEQKVISEGHNFLTGEEL